MDMMGFHHFDIVSREAVHNLCQVFVEGEENVYTDAEIGGIEKSFSLFFAHFFDLSDLVKPACSTGNNWNACGKTLHIIVECCCRSRKLDRDISTFEIVGAYFFGVIDIYDRHDLMSSAKCYLLDSFSHLSVTDKCNLHTYIFNFQFLTFNFQLITCCKYKE